MKKNYGLVKSSPKEMCLSFRELLEFRIREYPEVPMYSYLDYKAGERHYIMPDLVKAQSEALTVFINNTIGDNQKIGILANNSYEWILVMQSIAGSENVVLLLDKTLDVDSLSRQITRADCRTLFCDNAYRKKAEEISSSNNCSIFDFDKLEEYISLGNQMISEGKGQILYKASDPEATSFIMFTSGTTGVPKGVMLSQQNLFYNAYMAMEIIDLNDDEVYVLPLNHIYGLGSSQLTVLLNGKTVHICMNLRRMFNDFEIVRPRLLILVPMFIEMIYDKIMYNVKQLGQEQFDELIRKCDRENADAQKRREVFAPYTAVIGGEVTRIVSGGAPLNVKLAYEFRKIGIEICEGYGITECSPVLGINPLYHNKIGSVGRIVGDTEIKINNPDKDGNGEICARGKIISSGYYKMPQETAESFKDGWFYTGDKGYLDEEDYLYITGRIKNLIILSNGENVSPEEIESKLYLNEIIKEAVVYADNNSICAAVYLNEEYIERENISNPKENVLEYIEDINKHAPPYKIISHTEFRDTSFERTSSGKIKRNWR